MGELKRVFSKAVMNKDMDERLVPNGQYRDANNIEITTSEGSEVGTAQTLFGNTQRNQVLQNSSSLDNVLDWTTTEATIGGSAYNMMGPHNLASVVGTVANVNTDKIYYLVSGGDLNNVGNITSYFGATANLGVTNNVAKDYILEYDTINNVHRYVFVDIFKVYTDVDATTFPANLAEGSTAFHISAQAGQSGVPPGIRVGMRISGVDLTQPQGQQQITSSGLEVLSIAYDTSLGNDGNPMNMWQVTTNEPHGLVDNAIVTFDADRVLKFDKERLITGINILDDFLFWTDNVTEPKKIHIKRSIAGTGGSAELDADNSEQIFFGDNDYFHTRLVKDKALVVDPNSANSRYRVATNSIGSPVYTTEEHVTVIRKAPTQPLDLEMYRTGTNRVNSDGVANPTTGVIAGGTLTWVNESIIDTTVELYTSENTINEVYFANDIHLEVGDIVLISNTEDILNTANESASYLIRAKVIGSPIGPNSADNITNGAFALDILSIDASTPLISYDEDNPDGFYDFSEPGWGPWYVRLEDKRTMFENQFPRFSYRYKYQDGEYSSFAPWSQIAFLPDYYEYYPKKGYNLGMVNQLRSLKLRYYHHDGDIMPQDVVEIDILYKEAGKPNVYTVKTLKEETTGDNGWVWPNTLVNASHRGTFTIDTDMIHAVVPSNQILRPYDNVPRKALAQEVSANRLIYGNYLQNFHIAKEPIIRVGYESTKLGDSYYFEYDNYAYPSVKTMRKYQVGVVFSDGYGRETPVLTHESSTVTVLKDASDTRNRLTCQLDPKFYTHPSWAEYMSWYVKETSVEYYTMAMDRWYDAADGNIWISFPSSDRNKLDDETFIVLKKAHGTNVAVKEKARYRILAIENEAPDFIKTVKKNLGRIYNGAAATGPIGPDGSGFPFQDSSYVTIEEGAFEATFGDQLHVLPPDTIYLRFYGDMQRSEEYEISRVIKDSAGFYRLNLVGRIEEDADFLATADTFETAIDGISMEIVEWETENKPEFDGKFFVKIFKDKVLEEYVLMPEEPEYVINETQQIGYINNNGFTATSNFTGHLGFETYQLTYGDFDDYDGISAGAQGANNSTDAVASTTQAQAYSTTTADDGIYGIRNIAGTAWHPTEHWHHTAPIGIGGQGGYLYQFGAPGTNTDDVDGNSYLALNDAHNLDARKFWRGHVMEQRRFFIDACTAYTYCNGGVYPFPGVNNSYGGTVGAIFDDGGGGSQPNFDWPNAGLGAPGPIPSDFDYGYDGVGGYPYAANTIDGYGQPSRGIWQHPDYQDISFIDISWSGMGNSSNSSFNMWADGTGAQADFGPGFWGQSSPDSNVAGNGLGIIHRIEDVFMFADEANPWSSISEADAAVINADFANAWSFIQQLVTVGQKFRFNRDPDNVVYTVVAQPHPTLDTASGTQSGSGWADANVYQEGTGPTTGVWGIRNYRPDNDQNAAGDSGTIPRRVYETGNLRQRWTIAVTPRIGSVNAKYSPTTGTGGYILQNNAGNTAGEIVPDPDYDGAYGDLIVGNDSYQRALRHDYTDFDQIQLLDEYYSTTAEDTFTDKPAIWETEPKESVELDIYYQASGLIPLNINNNTNEEYLPIQQNGYGGTKFRLLGSDGNWYEHVVTDFNDRTITFAPPIGLAETVAGVSNGDTIVFTKRDSYSVTGHIEELTQFGILQNGSTTMTLHDGSTSNIASHHMANQKHWLDWNNCWCFGNGVESDRVRDDFNAAQVDNGVKASTVLAEQITEERRKHGIIWSGIYNSTSGVNDLNQFIAAEKITKDLNPVYGSIQNLLNRDTRLIVFCEDKILRGVTNKDALYNADGNPQLISSNRVVGDMTPYLGDFGISKNPESLAVTPNNVYFSDVIRGKVLALGNQGDGLRVISDAGMKDYFGDTFADDVWRSLGTYDERKKEYNLSIYKKYSPNFPNAYERITVSFSELSKGWISFKSFYPQQGISLNNQYYTFNNGGLYQHHINTTRNNFYGVQGTSDITVLFNDQPNLVKSFMALNYEGSKAKIPNFDTESSTQWLTGDYSTSLGLSTESVTDGEYFNLAPDVTGWYASEITTNLQECTNTYFKDKEAKYYGYLTGATTTHGSHCDMTSSNLDESEFSVQGIGLANITHGDSTQGDVVCMTIANNVTASYIGDDSTGDAWDTAADLAEDAQRWTCTSQTIEVEGGSAIGANTAGVNPSDTGVTSGAYGYGVNLTISPFDSNGNPTGALLSAANFHVGPEGPTATAEAYPSPGSGLLGDPTTTLSYKYTNNNFDDLNIDPDATTVNSGVFFSDTGTPGTPDNTINVAVLFNGAGGSNWPTADDTWYIDIDETLPVSKEDPVDPPSISGRKVCFHVRFPRILSPITYPPRIYDITADPAAIDDGDPFTIYNSEIGFSETSITQTQTGTYPEGVMLYMGTTNEYPDPNTWSGDEPYVPTTYLTGTSPSADVPYTYEHLNAPAISDRVMHDGYVPDGQTSLVAEYDFECRPHYQLQNEDGSSNTNSLQVGHYFFATENSAGNITAALSQMGDYLPYYEAQVIYNDTSDPDYWYDTTTSPVELNYSGFVLKKFKVRVFYTPPPIGELEIGFGDLPGGMCSINPGPHLIDIRFNCNHYASWMVEPDLRGAEISDVLYSREIGYDATSAYVRILGTHGASFSLSITRATSTTDNTPASYFNFETTRFQSTPTTLEGEIPVSGKYIQAIELPTTRSDRNYNIVVTPRLNASKTKPATHGTNIPLGIGDATIKKRGIKTITIRPVAVAASNFGTIPTQDVLVPAMHFNRRLRKAHSTMLYGIKGGNNSKSSTKITINKYDPRIRLGSILLTRYEDNGIPHNTTVTAIEENLITLSNAVSIPNNSDIHFLRKGVSTVPFSFEIPVKNKFTVQSDINYEANVFSGDRSIIRKTNGAVTAGKIISLDPESRGIIAGMAIQGDNLVNTVGYNYLRVASVNEAARTVNVDVNQDIPDGATLTFVQPESIQDSGEFSVYDGKHNLSLLHMQTSSSDGKLMVEGYFDIHWIGKDNTNIDILIDNFITIH